MYLDVFIKNLWLIDNYRKHCYARLSIKTNLFVTLFVKCVNVTYSRDVRGVGIPKGVNAFDYCSRANIIATGGVDKVIRVWHPHIFSRPTGRINIFCNIPFHLM